MPVFKLPQEHLFPDPELAREDGLLALGGDLDPHRVLLAYTLGIFAWYSEGQPILWHSPDPRFVLLPEELQIQRSLRKVLKKHPFELRMDTNFAGVIDGCARANRRGQGGTWITGAMRKCYLELHRLGVAHSMEAWREGRLVGGLYGVGLGSVYFGESMFHLEDDASKVAFVALMDWLRRHGCTLVDSQVYTDHLARFGAREIPRREYLERLRRGLAQPSLPVGPWSLDA